MSNYQGEEPIIPFGKGQALALREWNVWGEPLRLAVFLSPMC